MKHLLFDLDGTLALYGERSGLFGAFCQGILAVHSYLELQDILVPKDEALWARAVEEGQEAGDHRVRPLEGRLLRIFGLSEEEIAQDVIMDMCRECTLPLMARGTLFPESHEVLAALRSQGFRIAQVSNTPWGSPAYLWREELVRLGLDEALDDMIFCRDAGWRKPSARFFGYALRRLDARPEECLLIGDDPIADVLGASGSGIPAVLVDRTRAHRPGDRGKVRDLRELLASGVLDQ
jgi:putative hydrolase of the HAD superfamily